MSGEKIKRYCFIDKYGDDVPTDLYQIEDANGGWCKSEDVSALESRFIKMREERDRALAIMKKYMSAVNIAMVDKADIEAGDFLTSIENGEDD